MIHFIRLRKFKRSLSSINTRGAQYHLRRVNLSSSYWLRTPRCAVLRSRQAMRGLAAPMEILYGKCGGRYRQSQSKASVSTLWKMQQLCGKELGHERFRLPRTQMCSFEIAQF